MDLILWRHAEAEDGFPDLARALTAKGHKQAERMGAWLREHLPDGARVLVSPAARAQQTAAALTHAYQTVDDIAPGAPHTAVLEAAGWPDAEGAVVVVGHQPTLGQVVAFLLSGQPAEWDMKKGAVFWLAHRRGAPSAVLRAAMSPKLL